MGRTIQLCRPYAARQPCVEEPCITGCMAALLFKMGKMAEISIICRFLLCIVQLPALSLCFAAVGNTICPLTTYYLCCDATKIAGNWATHNRNWKNTLRHRIYIYSYICKLIIGPYEANIFHFWTTVFSLMDTISCAVEKWEWQRQAYIITVIDIIAFVTTIFKVLLGLGRI